MKMEKAQILIVDDSKEVLSALARELGDEPYTVLLAQNGKEALEIAAENEIKVIISDIKMPNMDGFALLDKVKENNSDIIRVVLSGHPDVKLILSMVNERGLDRYLTKPWHRDDLKNTIRQCLELYDLRTEVKELRARNSSQRQRSNHSAPG
ncbi:MAG: response regulator [Proteobacteria bacterium]|nr:response regulator [Pseudomonadota bacterium]MBU1640631.1 response regulator [Pseudomonadota bacterium]